MTSKQQEAQQAPPAYQYPAGYSVPPEQQGYVYTQQPQQVVMVAQAPPAPPDNLIFNILVTLFCCWPIGIFAIMKSLAVRESARRGDMQRAQEESAAARRLGFWTLGVGIFFVVIVVVGMIVLYAWYLPTYVWNRHSFWNY